MEETDKRQSQRKVIAIAVGILVAMCLLYPLSVGPAVWLHSHDYVSEQTLIIVYFPLMWLCERFPAIENLFDVYLQFWR